MLPGRGQGPRGNQPGAVHDTACIPTAASSRILLLGASDGEDLGRSVLLKPRRGDGAFGSAWLR